MRRSFTPAVAVSAGLCAVALTACTPENSSIGAAPSSDAADRHTAVTTRSAPRSPAIPSPRPTPAAPATRVSAPEAATFVTPAPQPTSASTDPTVISYEGTNGVRIGQTVAELTEAGLLASPTPGCSRRFAGIDYADPVFDHDRLAFIWAYPPLHTPEGVMVGTAIADLNRAYPNAERLTPPAGSPTFDGALVRNPNGVAYLILHDGLAVQKLIVGAENAVRMLYTQRLDTC
ncbi:hypothetical protein [Luedemannella flava]